MSQDGASASESVPVRCHPLSDFFFFEDIDEDELGNALLVPRELLTDGPADSPPLQRHGYAELTAAGGTGDPEVVVVDVLNLEKAKTGAATGAGADDGVQIYDEDSGRYAAGIRTNLLMDLERGDGISTNVDVVPLDEDLADAPLTVYPEYADENSESFNCYLSDALLDDLPVSPGDTVEAYSRETGGRIALDVHRQLDGWEFADERDAPYTAGIDGFSRRLLDIDVGDLGDAEIQIREPVHAIPEDLDVVDRVLKRGVDYNRQRLRVVSGLNRDEYENVARLHDDMFDVLGMDPGDMAVLSWNGDSARVRCLPKTAAAADDPLTVDVPHTVRDELDVNLDDCVFVRRDMRDTLKQEVALSLFGILGVVYGGVQVARLLALPIPPGLVAGLFAALVVVAVAVTWLVLYPVRQQS